MVWRPLSFCFIFAFVIISPTQGYKCKNIAGKPVDWFVAYKLPTGVPNANDGKNFVYADSVNPAWQLSQKSILEQSSAIGATVSDAYRNDPNAFLLMYSDDGPATSADSYRGHAKGVVLFNGNSGYWMVHSVPNFPPLSNYSYPTTGLRFAQSFLCVSVSTESLPSIGEHLMYIQATPFKSQLPERFGNKFPILRTVIGKKSLTSSATKFTTKSTFHALDGTEFYAYAKHKKYQADLWHNLIAYDMGISLGVQSWLNGGADDLHSVCTADAVNVFDITELNVLGSAFSSSKDHSKWAVSDAKRRPVVCVGDLNRQKSQLSRGGGALCIEHVGLWTTYRATVKDVEACMAPWARASPGAFEIHNLTVYLLVVVLLAYMI